MAKATIEDLIDYLSGNPSPFDMARKMPLMVEGLQNLVERLQVVEADRLSDIHRVAELEALTEKEKADVASVVKDRDAMQKELVTLSQRVDTIEKTKAPPAVGPSSPSPFPILPQPAPELPPPAVGHG